MVIPEISAPAPDGSFDKIRLTLEAVRFDGNTVVDTATLLDQFKHLLGQDVTLAQVFAATQSITKLYADRGYALSMAYLPAQEIEGGKILVRVVEGYIESVETTSREPRIAQLLTKFGDQIKASRPVAAADLETNLLLADDMPGIKVRSVVDRGTGAHGAMKLVINAEYDAFDVSLNVDNRGTEASGPWRARASGSLYSLFLPGDQVSLGFLRSFDDNELDYVDGSYGVTLNTHGTVATIEASNSNSAPGTADLSAIDFRTKGFVGSAKMGQSIIRSRTENLSAEVAFTYKDLTGQILGVTNSDDHLSVLSLSAHYDTIDALDGIVSVDVTLAQGLDIFDATGLGAPNPSRLGADAMFTRLELSLSRVQQLNQSLTLSVSAMGQYADSALLSSEQCGYGGARFGRAFDGFEIAGDHCAMGSAELRYAIPSPVEWVNYLQAYGFADAGYVQKRGLVLPGEIRDEGRTSAGVGFRAGILEHADLTLEYANPLGDTVAQELSTDGRVFFTLSLHD